jgi:hypothetical protein
MDDDVTLYNQEIEDHLNMGTRKFIRWCLLAAFIVAAGCMIVAGINA